MGWVTMSERDLRRVEVLAEVANGRRTAGTGRLDRDHPGAGLRLTLLLCPPPGHFNLVATHCPCSKLFLLLTFPRRSKG